MYSREKLIKYLHKNSNICSKLTLSQTGGFYLSDTSNDHMLINAVLKHVNTTSDIINNVLNPDGKKPYDGTTLIPIIQKLEDVSYVELYQYLTKLYFDDREYNQQFYDKTGKIFFDRPHVHKYHINFAALMFICFLVELELFTLLYEIIPFNTESNQTRNMLPSIFSVNNTNTRIFKDIIIKKTMPELFTIFAVELDKLFELFMSKLIENILKKYPILTQNDILEAIVPVEYAERIKQKNPVSPIEFDFIYVTWKDRLIKALEARSGTQIIRADNIVEINNCIHSALKAIENTSAEYIAEGTGFFSFIFLNFPNNPKQDAFFGSCITYSLLEMYIMSRLHSHAKNMTLRIESQLGLSPHPYWINITPAIRQPSVTHWATEFGISSLNPIKFRSISKFTHITSFNFEDHRSEIFKALTFPIFDSYLAHITCLSPQFATEHMTIVEFIKHRIENFMSFSQLTDPAFKFSNQTMRLLNCPIIKSQLDINERKFIEIFMNLLKLKIKYLSALMRTIIHNDKRWRQCGNFNTGIYDMSSIVIEDMEFGYTPFSKSFGFTTNTSWQIQTEPESVIANGFNGSTDNIVINDKKQKYAVVTNTDQIIDLLLKFQEGLKKIGTYDIKFSEMCTDYVSHMIPLVKFPQIIRTFMNYLPTYIPGLIHIFAKKKARDISLKRLIFSDQDTQALTDNGLDISHIQALDDILISQRGDELVLHTEKAPQLEIIIK